MTDQGSAVRALRLYRFSPDGCRLRVVRAGEVLGVPEEIAASIAAVMIDSGVAEWVREESAEIPSAAEILDRTAAKKNVSRKKVQKVPGAPRGRRRRKKKAST